MAGLHAAISPQAGVSAVAIAAVEGVEFTHVGVENAPEGFGLDLPDGFVFGMLLAMILNQPVQKLEEMAWRAHMGKGVLQGFVADSFIHKVAQAGFAGRAVFIDHGAGPQAVGGQVVKAGACPAQGFNQVQLVGPGAVVKFFVFFIKKIGQLNGQESLNPMP